MYSNPAGHGVFILDRILRDPAMTAEWQRELRAMVGRVADMRAELRKRLERLAPGHDWAPIATQGGTTIQCEGVWMLGLLHEGHTH